MDRGEKPREMEIRIPGWMEMRSSGRMEVRVQDGWS